ncbi:MAG: anti-sigma factor family protein [Candidatus Acidiferrales bacterium]
MNYKECEASVISYMDGRASEAVRRAVESHLAACAACRARAAEFRSVWSALDEAPALDPSPAFDARLRQRIAAEPRRTWFGWLVPAPRLMIATAALALLFVWVTMQPATQPPPDEQSVAVIDVDQQVLEDYDVLADFEALSTLPPAEPKDEM